MAIKKAIYKVDNGRDLEEFRTNLPEGDIGESWDIACHPNGTGIVANGELKGKSFTEIIEEFGLCSIRLTYYRKYFFNQGHGDPDLPGHHCA